jgi:hypothetical protein
MSPSSTRNQRSTSRPGPTARTPVGPRSGRSARRPDAGRRRTPPRRIGVTGGWIQRRQPEKKQSGLAKALGGLGGAVSRLGKSRAKPTKSSGKRKTGGQVGGVALLTAAAGLAFKNREKVTAMLRRDHEGAASRGPEDAVRAPAPPPATGVATTVPEDRPGTVSGDAGPGA